MSKTLDSASLPELVSAVISKIRHEQAYALCEIQGVQDSQSDEFSQLVTAKVATYNTLDEFANLIKTFAGEIND